jgi:hypothetical protein
MYVSESSARVCHQKRVIRYSITGTLLVLLASDTPLGGSTKRYPQCAPHVLCAEQEAIASLPGMGVKKAQKAVAVVEASRAAITLPQLLQGLSIPGGSRC